MFKLADPKMRVLAGKEVPAVGLGCMGLSEFYGTTNATESLKILHRAYEAGYRHFDTADMYGRGENELLLGQFLIDLGEKKNNVLVATKGGIVRNQQSTDISVSNEAKYLRAACERSLKRLQVESIDLYYLHRKDSQIPIEETMEVLVQLKKEGKIKAIGLSEVNAETLGRAHSIHPIAALQSEYSLWSRQSEVELIPLCESLGISYVAFSPLGRGFISGKVNQETVANLEKGKDIRATIPRFQGENLKKNLTVVEEFKSFAASMGKSPTQLALAWLLDRSPAIHVIPGSKTEKYILENFSALNFGLTPEEREWTGEIFDPGRIYGERYPNTLMKTVGK